MQRRLCVCGGYVENKCICGKRDVQDLSRMREVQRNILIVMCFYSFGVSARATSC